MASDQSVNIESQIQAEFAEFAQLNREVKGEKNKNVEHMIEYYHGLTGDIEERRNKIYDSSLQLVAILLAILGILITGDGHSDSWFRLVFPVLIIQLASSMMIILVYELQSKFHYPFLDMKVFGNQWKWFYRGNPHIGKISTSVLRDNRGNSRDYYLLGAKEFLHNYLIETLDTELEQNLQQLYLLQVHNYFKNAFYLHLTKIRTWSYFVSIPAIIVGIIWASL